MIELKQCGCGGKAETITKDYYTKYSSVTCSNCGMKIQDDSMPIEELIEAWNKAMSTPKIDKALEEMKKLYEFMDSINNYWPITEVRSHTDKIKSLLEGK